MKRHPNRLITDALREIRKTKSRFFSLFLLSALAVAFLAGLRTTAPDMEYTADAYYDAHGLMDIHVLSTLGLTREDVDLLAAQDGVAAAEGAYTADALLHLDDNDLILKLLSLSERGINAPDLVSGRLPENDGECLVEPDFLALAGVEIGDEIAFDTGTGTYEDALVRDTFTIVGTANSPLYLSFDRGSSSLGAGRVSAFVLLPVGAFRMDYFTDAYLLARGTKDLLCYSDGYQEQIDALIDSLDPLAQERAALRHDEVIAEATDALTQAEQEYADAEAQVRQELSDAWDTLRDARQTLDDGWKEWEEGSETLAQKAEDARKQLADAEAALPDALRELEDGEKAYTDGLTALEEGRADYAQGLADWQEGFAQYQDGEAEYQENLQVLTDAQAQYEDGLSQLEEGKRALAEGEAELEEARQTLLDGEAQYEDGLRELAQGEAELKGAKEALDEAGEQLDAGEASLAAGAEQLNEAQALYDAASALYDTQLQALTDLLASIDPSLTPESTDEEISAALDRWLDESLTEENAAQAVETLQGWVNGLPPEVLDRLPPELLERIDALTPEELLAAKEEVKAQTLTLVSQARQAEREAGEELSAMSRQLADAQAQVSAGSSQLVAARVQYGEGKARYEEGLAAYEAGKAQAEEARRTLDEGWEQYREGQKEIEENAALLEESQAKLDEAKAQLDDGWAQLAEGRATLDEAKAELDDGQAQLTAALEEIADGEKELADARQPLDDGWKAYRDGLSDLEEAKVRLPQELEDGQRTLDEAHQELLDGEEEYRDGLAKYEEGKAEADQELSDARRQLNDARRTIREIENCQWYILGRNTNMGYVSYQQDAQRMGNLASVFPLIFFLVAALVCLTTMTRMVEEQRVEIGGMKALGYGKWAISLKYVGYGFLASFTGGVAGLLLGCTLIPWIIFNAWKILYTVGELIIPVYPGVCLFALGAAVICVTGTAFAACFAALTAVPAQLMRPRAPKPGKRVLLEHLPFLWKKLSFTWKVTVRNLFRYKKRFIMTVVGIGGCTALLITGFGLRNSIYDILDKQFDEISTYSSQIALADDVTGDELSEISAELGENPHVLSWMTVSNNSRTVEGPRRTMDAYVFAVEDADVFSDFIHLRHRLDDEPVTLPKEGVLLTEKLADMLGVKPGDTVTITGDKRVEAPVMGITENYVFHYIYLSASYYEQLYGAPPADNMILARYDSTDQAVSDEISASLISLSGVTSVSRILDSRETFTKSMESVDYAVILITVCAAALAFVVLYNLTNINITERLRELATLKVLGFYNRELSDYVYRENIFLTLFGVLLGLVMGKYLHQWLVLTVEIDMVMFGRAVRNESYLYSILLTILFSLLVNLCARGRLKKIDMVESLKTVE